MLEEARSASRCLYVGAPMLIFTSPYGRSLGLTGTAGISCTDNAIVPGCTCRVSEEMDLHVSGWGGDRIPRLPGNHRATPVRAVTRDDSFLNT